jgi:hypothetical protein
MNWALHFFVGRSAGAREYDANKIVSSDFMADFMVSAALNQLLSYI